LTASTLLTTSQLLQFLRELLQCLRKLLLKTLWAALTFRTTCAACAARLALTLASAQQAGNCLFNSTSGLLQTSSCLLQAAGNLTHLSHHAHRTHDCAHFENSLKRPLSVIDSAVEFGLSA
jgi:hypothetical protein